MEYASSEKMPSRSSNAARGGPGAAWTAKTTVWVAAGAGSRYATVTVSSEGRTWIKAASGSEGPVVKPRRRPVLWKLKLGEESAVSFTARVIPSGSAFDVIVTEKVSATPGLLSRSTSNTVTLAVCVRLVTRLVSVESTAS